MLEQATLVDAVDAAAAVDWLRRAVGALRTLHAAGVRHAGDVVTAWVCDEESGEPGLGRSIGMHAVAARIDDGRIPRTDFAVYVEPTSLAVYTAQIGFVIADVEIEGRSA